MMKIAVVDDEKWPADDLARFVASLGYETLTFYDGTSALSALKIERIDLVISDVNMPGLGGLDLVKHAFEQRLPVQFILVSGVDEVVRTINAMELGVLDFLTKPTDVRRLKSLIKEYEKERNTATFSLSETGDVGIFSRPTKNLFRKLRKLQDFPQIPVLIQGETGTGKEVLARYLHHTNRDVNGPFIALNCSALTRELFEAELFGYEGGAFTGADKRGKPGKMALSAEGTLFLDEITELSPELQAKLLRVIQERSFFRVGGTQEVEVRTRIVCATNGDTERLVARGAFREDLFYRLNVCRVIVPPLRERREEIVPLTWMFLRRFTEEFGHVFEEIEPEALRLLEEYTWPGNVREMRNVLTNIAIFEEGSVVTAAMVHRHLTRDGSRIDGCRDTGTFEVTISAPDNAGANSPVAETVLPVDRAFTLPEEPFELEALNRRIVTEALRRFDGNRTLTARHLGLTRNQLYGRYRDLLQRAQDHPAC